MPMRRLVIFLIRKKLGLKKYERFQFKNQKTDAYYYFTDDAVYKIWNKQTFQSGVSVNWLFNDDCEILKYGVPPR